MSEKFKITGDLHVKQDTKQHSDKFKTRDFVIYIKAENSKYDQYLPFTLKNDNCSLVDGLQKGTKLTVEAYPGGRRWESPEGVWKYFAQFTAHTVQSSEVDILQAQFPEQTKSDLPF
tara:strand:- start:404 stop:754 length:351 start_codon:yes stop_codon:yes gene_type:complete